MICQAAAVLSPAVYSVPHRLPSSSQAAQGIYALVFFSTFEPITLTPNEVTQCTRVPKFYNTASSSNLPSLYICMARNVLGRVPLTSCSVQGDRTPTLPSSFGNQQGAVADSRNGVATAAGFMGSTFGCGVMAG